jgi:hypothetical protein
LHQHAQRFGCRSLSKSSKQKVSILRISLIHVIRGQKVMLDADLAHLYEVPTSALNQAVKRNRKRFPEDFIFELTPEEVAGMRSDRIHAESMPPYRELPPGSRAALAPAA